MQRVCHCNWEFCWRCLKFRLPDTLTKDQIEKLSDAEKCDFSLKLHLRDWHLDSYFFDRFDRVCKQYPLTPTQISRVAMWALAKICKDHYSPTISDYEVYNRDLLLKICLEMLQSPYCDILSFGGFASKQWILETIHRIRVVMLGPTLNDFVVKIRKLFSRDRYNTLKTQKRMTMNARKTAIYVVMAFRFIVSRDISRLIGNVVYNTRRDTEWNFKMKDNVRQIM